jgi:hypothetical protein
MSLQHAEMNEYLFSQSYYDANEKGYSTLKWYVSAFLFDLVMNWSIPPASFHVTAYQDLAIRRSEDEITSDKPNRLKQDLVALFQYT